VYDLCTRACVDRRSTTFSWQRRHIFASRSLSHVSRPKLPQMRSDSVARQQMTSRRVSSSYCNFAHIPLRQLDNRTPPSSHSTRLLHDKHTHGEMVAACDRCRVGEIDSVTATVVVLTYSRYPWLQQTANQRGSFTVAPRAAHVVIRDIMNINWCVRYASL